MKEYYAQSTELQKYMDDSEAALKKVWAVIAEMKERIKQIEEKKP